MLWEKISSTRKGRYALIFVFVLLFLVTRLPRLHNDVINPDGANWHYRSQQFINGLKYQQFEKTYQHYHPGVILMWATGVPVEVTKQLTPEKSYDVSNFQLFHFVAKFGLVFVQLGLTLAAVYVFSQIFGFRKSLLIAGLFSLEPFFVGNSRLYHMDILFTLLLFISLGLSYLYIKKGGGWRGVFSGLFLAFSFLTKSVGIGALLFVLLAIVLFFREHRSWKRVLSQLGVVLGSFVVFTFMFFPALWAAPLHYLVEIFSEAERVGIRKGHGQILFGEYTRNGGLLFYPLVTALKVSPFLLFGLGVYVFSLFKGRVRFKEFGKFKKFKLSFSPELFLTVFYLGYMLVMLVSSKKLDRYLLVIYPLLSLLSLQGYVWLKDRFKAWGWVSGIFGLVFLVYPLVSFFPYYFTYFSPVFGTAKNAHSVLAQKPFGVGVYELQELIYERYGRDVSMGFVDVKPMESIHANSKVFNIREYGASNYDILVLAVNEEIPDNLIDVFVQDEVLEINGLDYWRIYVKK
jgi:4-amino-4-deoxy-L-arabinose transferase-like glycosyltransferase